MSLLEHETIPVTILCGPTASGKTSRVNDWARNLSAIGGNVDGILAPKLRGGRCLCHISTGACEPLEAEGCVPQDRRVSVGRHTFDGAVFARAREHLARALDAALRESHPANRGPARLVVDEIGPLELRNEGLEPTATAVVAAAAMDGPRVVLVVRSRLVAQVIEHFGLSRDRVRLVRVTEV